MGANGTCGELPSWDRYQPPQCSSACEKVPSQPQQSPVNPHCRHAGDVVEIHSLQGAKGLIARCEQILNYSQATGHYSVRLKGGDDTKATHWMHQVTGLPWQSVVNSSGLSELPC